MTIEYNIFLERKSQLGGEHGFEPVFLPPFLFDFQRELVTWATRKGRSAIFADCGMGKTPMQLVWSENVHRKVNRPVLILTPLAVAHQATEEAAKFGIDAHHSHKGEIRSGVVISNYERLHYFDPSDFAGVVCDESSILKSFDGKTRQAVTEFMRKLPYRLLCTATAAPNDYTELGTSSEALGELGYMDMLNRFFKNDLNNSATGRAYGNQLKWRFKGHAEIPFWRWVSSWARAIRRPSDLGYDDGSFMLPELREEEHIVKAMQLPEGELFARPAIGLKEQREERRRTIGERCEKVASLVNDTGEPALVWCHLNDEADMLERIMPDAKQVAGSDSEEAKVEKLLAFQRGQLRVLVTKPKIGAWGLNFQHCSHVTFFPDHSYEQYYQGVRRCWRFGQKRPVKVDVVASDGARGVLANLKRKADQADKMFDALTRHMRDATKLNRITNKFEKSQEVPSWL